MSDQPAIPVVETAPTQLDEASAAEIQEAGSVEDVDRAAEAVMDLISEERAP